MKKIFTTILIFASFWSNAQEISNESLFDFWVGQWELTWDNGDNTIGKGTNDIVKILDGSVIQENFIALEGKIKGFKGTSISVWNPNNKTWHQAWADNQGGYFNFIGEKQGEKRIFKTVTTQKNGKKIIQRMVFYDITDKSLTWDWESSVDNGNTWNLLWRINYKKLVK